ncbi:thioredoxin reductase NTRB-like isoform X1 [Amborella trichopoda]|uniref:thioredoxin reductase NTRB-like isoform X1 n=1 Tax=Amborella trichopoda TaxID=13333 RepID=UPI0009BE8C74|nr:thioredoxin reductase NTRB-like isoform X1 [Amborella trichopoda]|eukprot:XP_020524848.1 thioredoxin reductase NTRB-like isoform X1 [Amborella trichopoda]
MPKICSPITDISCLPRIASKVESVLNKALRLARFSRTPRQHPRTKLCIIGSGAAAHTAAIYGSRAELHPILFEGNLANNVAPGGQLTTTTEVENFPGFPKPVLGPELTERFRAQSLTFGTQIFTETVTQVNFLDTPFKVNTDKRTVIADTVIIATGAVAKRLYFHGAGDDGFWNRGISSCAVCDGAAPNFRNKPLAVIGGGDLAMEEALFLTKFGSKVYIIHRRDAFQASKILQRRVFENSKIEILWNSEAIEAFGDEEKVANLGGLNIKNNVTGEVSKLKVSGLFFAIGHEPATGFLEGQVELDREGYIVTEAGTTRTSVRGIFAAGDVQDKRWRQAVTAAGTGKRWSETYDFIYFLMQDAWQHWKLNISFKRWVIKRAKNIDDSIFEFCLKTYYCIVRI